MTFSAHLYYYLLLVSFSRLVSFLDMAFLPNSCLPFSDLLPPPRGTYTFHSHTHTHTRLGYVARLANEWYEVAQLQSRMKYRSDKR